MCLPRYVLRNAGWKYPCLVVYIPFFRAILMSLIRCLDLVCHPSRQGPKSEHQKLRMPLLFSFCFLSAFPSLSLVFRVFSFQIPILLFVKFVVVCSIWMLFCVVRHLLRVHMTVSNTFRYTSTYVVVKSINLGNLFRPVQKLSAIETLKALESALKV